MYDSSSRGSSFLPGTSSQGYIFDIHIGGQLAFDFPPTSIIHHGLSAPVSFLTHLQGPTPCRSYSVSQCLYRTASFHTTDTRRCTLLLVLSLSPLLPHPHPNPHSRPLDLSDFPPSADLSDVSFLLLLRFTVCVSFLQHISTYWPDVFKRFCPVRTSPNHLLEISHRPCEAYGPAIWISVVLEIRLCFRLFQYLPLQC